MRHSLTRPILIGMCALLAVLVPASASAAELRPGNSTLVASGETIDDDLYVFGGNLDIQGTVNGDVVFFGGASTISGLVTGDVLVMGGATTITGDVRGSVRATGGAVQIGGRVERDVAVAAGSLDLAPSARIGRDLLAGVGSASLAAPIARNAFIGSGDVTLNAPVAGDVRADAGTLRLGSGAAVGGKLAYASNTPAEIASNVVVGGGIERNEPAYGRNWSAPLSGGAGGLAALGALLWLRGLLGMFVLGLVLILLVPASTRQATADLTAGLGKSVVVGVALLVGVPLVAMLVFGFGLVIGGWWLGIALLCLYALALGVGYITSAVVVGDWILARVGRRDIHTAWSLLAGVVTLGLLAVVPLVGGIVTTLAFSAGLGAVGLTAFNYSRGQRGTTIAAPAGVPVATAPLAA
jgi:cytoskeletal protein CcmA (bactofilin family)